MPTLKIWYNSKGEIKSQSSGSVSETIAMYNTMSRYIKAQARAMIEAGNAALYPTADTARNGAKATAEYIKRLKSELNDKPFTPAQQSAIESPYKAKAEAERRRDEAYSAAKSAPRTTKGEAK